MSIPLNNYSAPTVTKRFWQTILSFMPHNQLALLGCIFVVIGLFVSRSLMSIGMMTLVGNGIVNMKVISHLKSFFLKPYLVLLTGYAVMLSVSFFWSNDSSYFEERMQIILPFMVLPFAFHSIKSFLPQWYDGLFILFIVLCTTGMTWSLFQYIQHKESFDAGYGISKVIPTPFKNDHIRFSMAVVLNICFAIDLISRHKANWIKWVLTPLILFSIVYLHILAAKMGLVVFYMAGFTFLGKLFIEPRSRKTGFSILPFLIVLPFMMYMLFPSLRNKIGYVRYSILQIKNSNKEANISDEGRLISYGYAIDCIKRHPLIGVGLGDVRNEMQRYYQRDFGNKEVTILLPHNQFLMVGMAIGILGIFYLIILQLILFLQCYRHDFLSLIFCIIMFLASMVEPLYETQYGTCMFLFFLLLLLHRRTKTT